MDQQFVRPEEYYNTVGVEDYYDKVHRTTWARRVAATLAGGTLGMLFGGVFGAVGSFLPYVLTTAGIAGASAAALPAIGTIASAAALFSIIGSGIGITLNCDVSSNSASVASGLEEMEKRHKVERLQDGAAIQETAPAKPDDVPMSATIAPKTKLFSWKVAAITVSLFAAFGAVLACTPLALPAATLFGLHGTAAVIASASMFGMFGSLLGVKNSLITNKTNNFYFKILTEQYFEKPKDVKATSITPIASSVEKLDAILAPTTEIENKKSFAAGIIAEREAVDTKETALRGT